MLNEGIKEDKIFITENTIVDVVYQNQEIAKDRSDILDQLDLEHKEYFLATAHRQDNVDDPVRLAGILNGLEKICDEYDVPVIYLVHPRSKKRLSELGMHTDGCVKLIDPVDFLDFLHLESNARLVLTDSGSV